MVNNGGFGSSITTNGSTFTTIILQSGFYQIHFESITTNLSGNVGYPFISMPGAGGVWISVGGDNPGRSSSISVEHFLAVGDNFALTVTGGTPDPQGAVLTRCYLHITQLQ